MPWSRQLLTFGIQARKLPGGAGVDFWTADTQSRVCTYTLMFQQGASNLLQRNLSTLTGTSIRLGLLVLPRSIPLPTAPDKL